MDKRLLMGYTPKIKASQFCRPLTIVNVPFHLTFYLICKPKHLKYKKTFFSNISHKLLYKYSREDHGFRHSFFFFAWSKRGHRDQDSQHVVILLERPFSTPPSLCINKD
ncbi:hypothetical protein H5410_057840 [Solanum commersonii]|uniref:Uncharacterized protein n=1 Tax=Solanum commersonii TaxID=4109 RepID=A0A9J5WQ24_SOLCO|nr:hypothetical protein H5410_057840 [Solanum commersonii]